VLKSIPKLEFYKVVVSNGKVIIGKDRISRRHNSHNRFDYSFLLLNNQINILFKTIFLIKLSHLINDVVTSDGVPYTVS
jgi:hypothetical protein